MHIKKVAIIVFYDNDKRILLQYRVGISKYGTEWGFFGGHIEKDETPEIALKREIKEELDYDLTSFDYLGEIKKRDDTREVQMLVFMTPLEDKLSMFRQIEGEKMKLFTLDEAEKLKLGIACYDLIKRLKEIL